MFDWIVEGTSRGDVESWLVIARAGQQAALVEFLTGVLETLNEYYGD